MTSVSIELAKTRTTSTVWWLALAALGLVATLSALVTLNMTSALPSDAFDVRDGISHLAHTPVMYAYSFAARVGYAFPFLFGALLVTNEYRHRTMGRSVLLSGSRSSLYVSKNVVTVLVGTALGASAAVLNAAVVAGVLASRGYATELGTAAVQGVVVRTVGVFALWALIGVGVGALIRHQVVTIVVVLAFTLFVEPTLTAFGNENSDVNVVARFLPGASSLSLAWPPDGGPERGMGLAGSSLGWWQGGLVLALYAAVFVLLGYVVRARREDITD